jgi:NADPH:quinone reductase-like Zn-dependent oxidoreductase
MGHSSDATAVVHSHLRVHGLRGLRVVAIGVMPTITSGNTNNPTLMIAEKAARWIAAGKDAEAPYLGALGAASVLGRTTLCAPGEPLQKELLETITREIPLSETIEAARELMAGKIRGRIVVRTID